MVEGVDYGTDLRGVYHLWIKLKRKHQLVYSPHNYSSDEMAMKCYSGCETPSKPEVALHTDLGNKWGFILARGKRYTAPVWVGEFGTCHTSETCVQSSGTAPGCTTCDAFNGFWFSNFVRYLRDGDIDWSYWAINGTEARGDVIDDSGTLKSQRTPADAESYGVFDKIWSDPAQCSLAMTLNGIVRATEGPKGMPLPPPPAPVPGCV